MRTLYRLLHSSVFMCCVSEDGVEWCGGGGLRVILLPNRCVRCERGGFAVCPSGISLFISIVSETVFTFGIRLLLFLFVHVFFERRVGFFFLFFFLVKY